MSDTLYEKLCEKFPQIGPVPRISTYPEGGDKYIERIHLNLIEEAFLGLTKPLLESKDIENLAKEIFDDIPYEFHKHPSEGNIISFLPEGVDEYAQSYMGHDITIKEPLKHPKITILTGNRGSIKLHPEQRDKYFQFAVDLYETFLEKNLGQLNIIK
ncbi:MAG: hypothetical protein KAT28_05105 [Candidatus Aenigmarchaeota archaeon]|nr:hypothetical protein [Candidatus Aenigmarchaeota archaeon]